MHVLFLLILLITRSPLIWEQCHGLFFCGDIPLPVLGSGYLEIKRINILDVNIISLFIS
jgi:hypothetical protein